MKKLIIFFTLISCSFAWGKDKYPLYTYLYFTNSKTRVASVTAYKGETVRIPFVFAYNYLRGEKYWDLKPVNQLGLQLENVGPNTTVCPAIVGDTRNYPYSNAYCNMNLVISTGNLSVGETRSGVFIYKIRKINIVDSDMYFSVRIISHPLSMASISYQDATIGKAFSYDFTKNAVRYYAENVEGHDQPVGTISKEDQAALNQIGLTFNPNTLEITGIPTKTGPITVHVGSKNKISTAAPTAFTIRVNTNPAHKPVFKKSLPIVTSLVDTPYEMNLLSLLEPQKGYLETNQLSFSVSSADIPGFRISEKNSSLLVGNITKEYAGQSAKLTIAATSNTGGTTLQQIIIPIQHDIARRPEIKPFALEFATDNTFHAELASSINDPAHDPTLKIIIDKVERVTLNGIEQVMPTWLYVTAQNPTMLQGAPQNIPGEKYLLTLRANTLIGGPSQPITIPLQISQDKKQIPIFKADNPVLPLVYPGQAYFYDFVKHLDVYPEYEYVPYTIQFAEGYEHPDWLKLENNQLIATKVPEDLDDPILRIRVVIKNIPGGSSPNIPLVMIVED